MNVLLYAQTKGKTTYVIEFQLMRNGTIWAWFYPIYSDIYYYKQFRSFQQFRAYLQHVLKTKFEYRTLFRNVMSERQFRQFEEYLHEFYKWNSSKKS